VVLAYNDPATLRDAEHLEDFEEGENKSSQVALMDF
jgi:hypothetical protein